MNKQTCITLAILFLIPSLLPIAAAAPIERKILNHIASPGFAPDQPDRTCRYQGKFVVYLIDNFEQPVQLIPEVRTTHGELLRRILESGRDDIVIKQLNTSLTRGLALVINDLRQGQCADAVISSIPGSNYTYTQINSLLPDIPEIRPQNILRNRERLVNLMEDIAFSGFPSHTWVNQIRVNTSKLMNDARKIAFAKALEKFKIPLLIPYGNEDSNYLKEERSINILSLVGIVRAYSALDQLGQRITGFPYSPLSHGDEQAVYNIVEMPHHEDPLLAHLDVNSDGHADFTFRREGRIAFRNRQGTLSFSPPLVSDYQFENLKIRDATGNPHILTQEYVLTTEQYREIHALGLVRFDPPEGRGYIWLNAPDQKAPFHFKAVQWIRGLIRGTSLIPPNKVKELLSMAGTGFDSEG